MRRATTAPAELLSPRRSSRYGTDRRTLGRVAGLATLLSAVVAAATLYAFSPHPVPLAFDVVAAVSVCTGAAFILIPWDRLPGWCLHQIPLIAILETAVGIRIAGLYDDIAVNYYVFIAVFVGYGFRSRMVVAGYVVLLSVMSALPLLYHPARGGENAPRTAVAVLLLVVITGIVTQLRESLQTRQQELEELAVRDPLTGVGNYRLLTERLEYEIARHRRSGAVLTVMLLDLDGFKEVNDSFGHPVGDRLLVKVARALDSAVRARDTVARQGGDEFSILAPDTDGEQAEGLARRAQQAVAAGTGGTLSTSVGWVTFPGDGAEPAILLARADADLRRAKRQRSAPARIDPSPEWAILGSNQ